MCIPINFGSIYSFPQQEDAEEDAVVECGEERRGWSGARLARFA